MRRDLWKRFAVIAVVLCVALSGLTFASGENYTDRETVVAVQEALNKAGYNCGTPDGIAGSRTAEAISSYQRAHNLAVTGTITDELLAEMGLAKEAEAEEQEAAGESATLEKAAEELQEDNSDVTAFTPLFMNTLEKSAEEWITGEYMRAMATATLVVDLSVANVAPTEELVYAAAKTSYIGMVDSALLAYLHGDGRDIFVFYKPEQKEAFYKFMDVANDSILLSTLKTSVSDEFYQNNSETVISVLQLMSQAIGNN